MGTSNPPTTGSSYPPPPVAGSFPAYFPQPPTTATGGMATSANPAQQAGLNGAIQGCVGQASQIPNTGTISQEHIRASLLSAVEDKLKKRLKETVAQAQVSTSSMEEPKFECDYFKRSDICQNCLCLKSKAPSPLISWNLVPYLNILKFFVKISKYWLKITIKLFNSILRTKII